MAERSMAAQLRGREWLWAYAASALALAAITAGGGSALETASTAFAFAAFTALASMGQMLVVTAGGGNVDLSIPSAMTFGGVLAMTLMDGNASMVVPGIALALLAGAAIGVLNALLVRTLQVPPVIATLGSSMVVLAGAIAIGRSVKATPPPALQAFVQAKLLHMPVVAIVVLLLALAVHFFLERMPLGRALCAAGQNSRAAMLAGLPVWAARGMAYALSGVLAALTGVLLAAYSGGASLDLGSDYLLATIAVVVMGGTAASGGKASVAGVLGASLFLFLLVSLLNTFQIGAGLRTVLTGAVIVATVAISGKTRSLR